MDAYLNELSCFPLCTSKEEARERAYKFASLLYETQQQGFGIVRCPDRGISDIHLCKDYTVADFCNENLRGKEEMLLLSMLHPPYFKPDSKEEETYIKNKFSIEVPNKQTGEKEKKEAYGLSAACLNKSIGQNLCSCEFWEDNKIYTVCQTNKKEKKTYNVFSFSNPEDYKSEHYIKWQVDTRDRKFYNCGISPKQKRCNLSSDHHGNKELREFAENSLFILPYITEVVTSIAYSPHCKTFVKKLQFDAKRIEIVLTWTDKGFGMVVQTTARNDIELYQMADELEKKFG